jgi:hypothetical protein
VDGQYLPQDKKYSSRQQVRSMSFYVLRSGRGIEGSCMLVAMKAGELLRNDFRIDPAIHHSDFLFPSLYLLWWLLLDHCKQQGSHMFQLFQIPCSLLKTVDSALWTHSIYISYASASVWSERARANLGYIPGWWVDPRLGHPFLWILVLSKDGCFAAGRPWQHVSSAGVLRGY